jgi:hypothetical protein
MHHPRLAESLAQRPMPGASAMQHNVVDQKRLKSTI